MLQYIWQVGLRLYPACFVWTVHQCSFRYSCIRFWIFDTVASKVASPEKYIPASSAAMFRIGLADQEHGSPPFLPVAICKGTGLFPQAFSAKYKIQYKAEYYEQAE